MVGKLETTSAELSQAIDHRPSAPARLLAAWRRYWFLPVAPDNLGWCRAIFCGLMFLYFLPEDYRGWATVPHSFLAPLWLFAKLHLPIFPASIMGPLQFVWKLSLLLACIGCLTRLSTAIAFALAVYLIGTTYNFGKIEHMTAIAILTLGILSLSRCGDGVSIDALLARRRGKARRSPSGEYRWPVRAVWVLMVVVFFSAGLAKIKNNGLGWVTSDAFGLILIMKHYEPLGPPIVNWGLLIARHPWLCKFIAGSSMAGELGFGVALFSPKARRFLPAMMASMQIGIGLLMGIWFTTYLFVYIFWIPWDKLIRRTSKDRRDLSIAANPKTLSVATNLHGI